jgi:hypothetical protein
MIAEPPPSSLVLVVGAFFEPGELSTRELGGRRTALQEPAELCVDHGRFVFFFFFFGRPLSAMAWQRPSEGKKEMNLHGIPTTCRSSGSKVSDDQPQQQVAAAARTKRLQRETALFDFCCPSFSS